MTSQTQTVQCERMISAASMDSLNTQKSIDPNDLIKSWTGNMWQIQGELPEGQEKPYNERKLIMRPWAKQQSRDVLTDAGVACSVMKGDKYGDGSPGQDNISISRIQNGWDVFCVADGHGSLGHWVSTHATRTLPYFLAQEGCQELLASGDARGALLQAFELTQAELVDASKKEGVFEKLSISGTTFACILKDPEHKSAWVAHLGDSRTIMFSPDSVLLETQDHKVEVPSELKRIEDGGCEVRTKNYEDGFSSSRIYVKEKDYPGIMMTRCFGDQCVKAHGITAEPEIAHWGGPGGALSTTADANECYILMASDGIWEFLDTSTVHHMVSRALRKGKCLQEACGDLIAEAKKRWSASEPEYCDDISVIILPLTGKAFTPVEPTRTFRLESWSARSFFDDSDKEIGCFSACGKCVLQ